MLLNPKLQSLASVELAPHFWNSSPKNVIRRKRKAWDYSLWPANNKSPTNLPWSLAAEDRGGQCLSFVISCHKSAGWVPIPPSSQSCAKWQIPRLRQSGWALPWHRQPALYAGTVQPDRPVLPGRSSALGGAQGPKTNESHTGWHTGSHKQQRLPFLARDPGLWWRYLAVAVNIPRNLPGPENETQKTPEPMLGALPLSGVLVVRIWEYGSLIASGCPWFQAQGSIAFPNFLVIR